MVGKAVGVIFVLGVVGAALGAFDDEVAPSPVDSVPTTSLVVVTTAVPTTDPTPAWSPATPSAPMTTQATLVVGPSVGTTDEIDCERAEEYADSGEYEAGDIADYCDYGPDDGSELPDEFDWDE